MLERLLSLKWSKPLTNFLCSPNVLKKSKRAITTLKKFTKTNFRCSKGSTIHGGKKSVKKSSPEQRSRYNCVLAKLFAQSVNSFFQPQPFLPNLIKKTSF